MRGGAGASGSLDVTGYRVTSYQWVPRLDGGRKGATGGPQRKLERGGGEAAHLADEPRDLERGAPVAPDRTPRTWSEGHPSPPTPHAPGSQRSRALVCSTQPNKQMA
jgi:hypothetical protein